MTELVNQIREAERVFKLTVKSKTLTEYKKSVRLHELSQLLLILRQDLVDTVENSLKKAA